MAESMSGVDTTDVFLHNPASVWLARAERSLFFGVSRMHFPLPLRPPMNAGARKFPD